MSGIFARHLCSLLGIFAVVTALGAELRRYGKPHCVLWWGQEWVELLQGWQRSGAGELREPPGKFGDFDSRTLFTRHLPRPVCFVSLRDLKTIYPSAGRTSFHQFDSSSALQGRFEYQNQPPA